jgi:lipid-A-disaccharide synthase
MLPIMVEVGKRYPSYQCIIAGAPSQHREYYNALIGSSNIPVLFGQTSEILRHADAGLITSGTATLEAGIYRVPQVVCYKSSAISYAIAKRLVKIKYISLVNLILDRKAVTELIQSDLTAAQLETELTTLLTNPERQLSMSRDYELLREMLGGKGASHRTAIGMLKIIRALTSRPPIQP